MIVLGLDVSTSITGYCLIEYRVDTRDRLLVAGGIVTSHLKDPYEKALSVRSKFNELKEEFNIDKVIVEENLQAFRRGLSSAKTLSTLARFNGVVSFIAQDVFEVPTNMINVNAARALAGVKVDRKSQQPIKEQILKWVKSMSEFSTFCWPTKTLKSGPRKGKTIDAPECFDIADAAVVCVASIKLEQ